MGPTTKPEDEEVAAILAAALSTRPERVEDALLGLGPPGVREMLRDTRELFACLALAEPAAAPVADVRARLLSTVARRRTRRAVLVIDMIHDHLDPGATLEVPRARAIVPALAARIEQARAAGEPVVYVVDEHEADDPELDAWSAHAIAGTGGNDVWPDLAPTPADAVVKKQTYSGFCGSRLAEVLEGLDVDTLVLTGCLTEIGIMATAVDALQRGFAVEVPAATQAGSCVELEGATLVTLSALAPFGPARKARLERAIAP